MAIENRFAKKLKKDSTENNISILSYEEMEETERRLILMNIEDKRNALRMKVEVRDNLEIEYKEKNIKKLQCEKENIISTFENNTEKLNLEIKKTEEELSKLIEYDKATKFRKLVKDKYKISETKKLFYIKKDEKYAYVKNRLKNLEEAFKDYFENQEFMPVNFLSATSFYIYGMITKINDQPLTKDSIYISSNIDESNNVLVKLDLSNVGKISLYPGQAVVLRGKNISNEFIVEFIYSIPPVEQNFISRDVIKKFSDFYAKKSLEIGICNGPFINDLKIFKTVLEKNYDVLILFGPFLSVYNENINILTYFDDIVIPALEAWLKRSMFSKIVIVPSLDEYNLLNIFPQPIYKLSQNDRIKFLPNPSLFYINEFLFGCCNFDNLFQLSSTEYLQNKGSTGDNDCSRLLFEHDRSYRLYCYLIYQGTFLPVFPNNDCVDYSCFESFNMEKAPDFYITTSKLKEADTEVGPFRVINLGNQRKIENKSIVEISIGKEENTQDYNVASGRYKITRKKLV